MSVNTKMTAIADAIRGKTGGTEALTLDAMAESIAALATGETAPRKFYETDIEVPEGAYGVVCTVSTGLSVDYVVGQGELVLVAISCTPADPEATNYAPRAVSVLTPQYGVSVETPTFYYANSRAFANSKRVAVYISAATTDLSSLTVSANSSVYLAVAGTYHLELYRTGFVL